MSLGVQLGLALALATAVTSILGFLWKHRGAVEAPAIQWRAPLRSTRALLRSKWFMLGMAVAMASWGLHVAALALAPISLVQCVIAGGLVLLTPIADRLFGHPVGRREWIGVGLVAAGLAFLALTLDGAGDEAHADYEAATLTAYVGLAAVIGLVLCAARDGHHQGYLLAAAAGFLWGGSDVSIKALSGELDAAGMAVLVDPLAAVILVLSLIGLLVSARSLQVGDAIPVIAVTSAAANTTTIASGPLVFGEPMPDETLGVAVRVLAFVLVIAAAALTPPPVPDAESEVAA